MSRKIYIIIAMVFTVVLSVSTFFIIRNHIDSAKQNEVYDNLAEIVEDEPPKENEGVTFSEDKKEQKELSSTADAYMYYHKTADYNIAIALCSNQGIFAIRIKIILEKFQTFGKHFLHLHQDKR